MAGKCRFLIVAAGVVWTIMVLVLLNRVGDREDRLIHEIALSQSRGLVQLLVNMRSWNAQYGGVYVPVTEQSLPDPYLDHPRRDVGTSDGTALTLINPAYMTRQVSEIGLEMQGVQTRITSLSSIRPENAPGDWEAGALRSF